MSILKFAHRGEIGNLSIPKFASNNHGRSVMQSTGEITSNIGIARSGTRNTFKVKRRDVGKYSNLRSHGFQRRIILKDPHRDKTPEAGRFKAYSISVNK